FRGRFALGRGVPTLSFDRNVVFARQSGLGGFAAVSFTARLLEVTDALTEAGLQLLIMGGYVVRHYGVDRNTFDFDFHVSADSAGQLEDRLRRTRLFSGGELKEGVSWRRDDFRRFQIGVLPNDREE